MIEYSQIRDNLLNTVDRLSGAVRDESVKSLRGVKTKLEEEAFNLVILGQFKRGKSTFINALMGESLLPTAIIPLTSVVTGARTTCCPGP